MCPFHEKEDVKKGDEQSRISTLAISFGALVTLTIALLSTRNDFPVNYHPVILILLLIMILVLVIGFWGKSMSSAVREFFRTRRYDKLAKSNFKNFRELVIRFGDLTEDRPDNIQTIMKDIKNYPPFSQITGVPPIRIQELYKYYNKHLDQFNETGDGLIVLVKEFENILYLYYEVYINEPIKQVKNIGSDKVPESYRPRFVKAQNTYKAFIIDYNNFAKIANEGFGSNRLFKDSFDQPEEL